MLYGNKRFEAKKHEKNKSEVIATLEDIFKDVETNFIEAEKKFDKADDVTLEEIYEEFNALEDTYKSLKGDLKELILNVERYEYIMSDSEYENYLDEIYGEVKIAGYKFNTGRALKELDPIAFSVSKSDVSGSLSEEVDVSEEFEDDLQYFDEECSALSRDIIGFLRNNF